MDTDKNINSELKLYEALENLCTKMYNDYEKYREKYENCLRHLDTTSERTFNNTKGRMYASRDAWKQLAKTLNEYKPNENESK